MNKLSWVVFCTLAVAAAARAADSTAPKDDNALEEVVVLADRAEVATKTATLLVEIPQSVSIVTADQIAERGVFNYQDVFRYTAGVDTERFGDDQRGDSFSARGFPLKQYLDGLNKTPNFVYGSRIETFTLERAEVLRGPSAVLYGAGSAGGLLNAVSKRPKSEFGGELGLEFGDYKRKVLNADVTGPLGDNFSGRFVGVARDAELMSPGQKNDKYVAMPSVSWKPSERTDVTFIGLWQKEDLGTQTYLPLEKTLHASPSDPSIPIDFFVGEPGFNHMKTDQYAGTLLINHRFSDLIAVGSNTRYIDQKVDYAEIYSYGFPPYEDPERTLLVRQFYVLDTDYTIFNTDNHAEFDFATGGLTHKVLVGIDYTKYDEDRKQGFSCPGFTEPPCWSSSPPSLNVYDPVYGQPFTYGITDVNESKNTQLGYYLQDQMKLNKFSFVLGVRRDEASAESTISTKHTNNATTYKLGVIAELLPGFSPFLSYSESFEPVLASDVYGNPFKPQEGRQYEGGIKWQPNPNSLVTATYYDIEENNFLSQDPNNIQNNLQGGVVGSKGYELEAIVNFQGGFGLTANYSHNKTEVIEATSSHAKGDRLEDLPEDLASLWANKTFTINEELAWRIGAGVRYVGDKIDASQLVKTPSVTLFDAMAQVSWKTWYFALNVNNVADKEYYASCGVYFDPYGTCSPGMTRTIVGSITKKF